MERLLFAKVREGAKIPTKRDEDAGLDVYAYFEEDFMILPPHQATLIPTGLYSCVSDDYVLLGRDRGSTGTKGMRFASGVIDSSYRGEIFIPIVNETDREIVIAKSEEIFKTLILTQNSK